MKKYIFKVLDKRINKQITTIDELLKRTYPNITVQEGGIFSFDGEDYEIEIVEK